MLKMLRPNLHARYSPPLEPAAMLAQEAGRAALLASVDAEAFAQVYGFIGAVELEVDDHLGRVVLDLPYYVMQKLSGTHLEALIARYQKSLRTFIPWDNAFLIVYDVAVALRIAHEHGIVHRDLKPNNIFIHRSQFRDAVIKILDFGISAQEGADRLGSTGTARHMPPEFTDPTFTKESRRSDTYALGLLIYEVAALCGPFDQDVIGVPIHSQRQAFALAHRTTIPRPLSEHRKDTPAPLVDLVARMLQKRPADRPELSTVIEELDALKARLGTPSESRLSDMLAKISGKQGPTREYISAPGDGPPIISELFGAPLVGQPVMLPSVTEPLPAQPASVTQESVRVFRSTAEIFDSASVWADDVYQPSPFESTDLEARKRPTPRPAPKDTPEKQARPATDITAPGVAESSPVAGAARSSAERMREVRVARRKALVWVATGGLGLLVAAATAIAYSGAARTTGPSPAKTEPVVSAPAAIAPSTHVALASFAEPDGGGSAPRAEIMPVATAAPHQKPSPPPHASPRVQVAADPAHMDAGASGLDDLNRELNH